MLGRFQLLCQFHPNSSEYYKDLSVSMNNFTAGSEPLFFVFIIFLRMLENFKKFLSENKF